MGISIVNAAGFELETYLMSRISSFELTAIFGANSLAVHVMKSCVWQGLPGSSCNVSIQARLLFLAANARASAVASLESS